MAFPRPFIDEVRRSVDSLQVIGEAVALKRRGSRWVGLCPFHSEKTPSFTVNEDGLWHCFGCGEGGDIYRFVMEQEALGFSDAVRSLADRAGLALPEMEKRRPSGSGDKHVDTGRVIEVLAAADAFYRAQLEKSGGAERAHEFLVGRGFDDFVVQEFGLGLAPDAWDAAQKALMGKGFSETELEVAGIVKPRDTGSGTYDRLRDRIIFPIRDLRGRTIAFGGRVLDKGEPKYLNSPETPTFNKSRTLYGLFEARDAIGTTGFAFLVEGYFDLIACAQYGVRNAVAPLGTSFTQEHARLLARFTRKAIIGFDGDTAGQAAAERTVGVFLGQGFQVNVVRLPTEHDPDSYLQEVGAEGLHTAMKGSDSGLEFLIHRAGERQDLGTPHGKAEALASLLEFVVPITERVERAEWIGRLAERLDIEPRLVEEASADVAAKMRNRQGANPQFSEEPRRPAAGSGGGGWKADLDQIPLSERDLLRAVLEHPEWRERLEEFCARDEIRDARVRGLLDAAEACDADGVAVDVGNLLARCEQPGSSALMSRLQLEEGLPLDWDAARNCALGIHDDSLRRKLREMSKDIREALEAGDTERFSKLNQEKVSLAQRISSA